MHTWVAQRRKSELKPCKIWQVSKFVRNSEYRRAKEQVLAAVKARNSILGTTICKSARRHFNANLCIAQDYSTEVALGC
jgi:hypothetical protein